MISLEQQKAIRYENTSLAMDAVGGMVAKLSMQIGTDLRLLIPLQPSGHRRKIIGRSLT